MNTRTFIITVCSCLVTILLTQAAVFAGGSAGSEEKSSFDMTTYNGKLIAENSLVATAPRGTLPNSISTPTFTVNAIHSTSLFGSNNEVVLYEVKPVRGGTVDYEMVIDFLEVQVPGSCIDLNLVYGSPNIVGSGSQYPIEGADTNDAALFYGHWAWQQIHAANSTPYEGQGTIVAILDAWQQYANGDDNLGGSMNSADLWNDPNITYHAPVDLPPISNQSNSPSMVYHGDTIMSLARVIAPASDYWAVQTLNEQGYGYTYSVVQSLDYVLTSVAAMGGPDLVVNMSFGADAPDYCGILAQLIKAGRDQLNVIYVAAAGNEYGGEGNRPLPQYPAHFDAVIATAASDNSGQMASYTNLGDVFAPGGDESAESNPGQCDDPSAAIIGRIPTPTGMINVVTCGSSFSAGYTSGLAAAAFSGPTQEDVKVVKNILMGTQENNSIIDVAYTLSIQ